MRTALFLIGFILGAAPSLAAQEIAVDPESAIARAALKPAPQAAAAVRTLRLSADTARQGLSRGAATGIGFLAGAGAGLVIAYFVNESQQTGEGRLENYIAIPLALGVFTAATVFVAMGD